MNRYHEARMWARIDKTRTCWIWRGPVDRGGYGRVATAGEVRAHRAIYRMLRGPIPEGLDLDHLCRVRNCVNPDHLEPVTRRVNILRGISPPALHARRRVCKSGHPFDKANTRSAVERRGQYRACRSCNREAVRRYKARKREAA